METIVLFEVLRFRVDSGVLVICGFGGWGFQVHCRGLGCQFGLEKNLSFLLGLNLNPKPPYARMS